MRSVLCSTLLAAGAAVSFVLTLSKSATAAEIGLPYAGASVRTRAAGHAGYGEDFGHANRIETSAFSANDYRQPGTTDAWGLGQARSTTFDSVGVLASLDAGRQTIPYPGAFSMVEAAADAFREVTFRVESDSLATGSPVEASIVLHFDGSFTVADNSHETPDASQPHAYIDAYLDVYDGDGWGEMLTFYRGTAGYSVQQGFFDSSDWQDRFIVRATDASHFTATLDYTTQVPIQTRVGDTIFVNFALSTGMSTSPDDVAIAVDFYNTGSFALTTTDPDVRIAAIVPEPATLSLLGLGAVALLFRRRH